MFRGLRTQERADLRGLGENRLRRLVLGVEGAQRVRLHAGHGVRVEVGGVILEVGAQFGDVGPAGLQVAEVVQEDHLVPHADRLVDGIQEGDHLDVDQRVGGAEGLDPDLGVLPVASPLLALLAEHRPDVEELYRLRELEQVVLDVGPHGPWRPLGPQGHLTVALVPEGEHLFLHHDVRGLPRRAGEELDLFKDRRPDLLVVVVAEDLARASLDVRPQVRPLVRLPAAGEDVVGAPRPLVAHETAGGRYGFVSSSSRASSTGPWPA